MVTLVRLWLLCLPVWAMAQESLNIAVTSSFKPVIEALAEPFAAQTQIRLNISSASTGVLYQQILSGAPMDVFLSADDVRPVQLAQQLSITETQVSTYAIGTLVLVVNSPTQVKPDELNSFLQAYPGRVVMANPALAPYGLAAQKVLDSAGFQGERILANNVIQARQYLSLGLAEVGLIAASVAQGFAQVIEVDASLYPAIKQQLLIVKPSAQAQAFVSFLASSDALDMIEQFGYQRPEP